MRRAPIIDRVGASGAAVALEIPRLINSNVMPVRQWGFASDARAWLLVSLGAADGLAILITGVVSNLIRNGVVSLPQPYWAHIVVGCVLFSNMMLVAGQYQFGALRRHREHLVRVTGFWLAVVLLLIAIIYLSGSASEFSRGWLLIWAVGGWLGLVAVRTIMWRVIQGLRARGELVTRVAVIGDGMIAERCAQRLQAEGNEDVQVLGVFRTWGIGDSGREADAHHPFGDLAQLTADMGLDEIVVAASCARAADLSAPLARLSSLAADIKLCLNFDTANSGAGAPSILVPLWGRPLAGLPAVFKRAIDICITTILLAAGLPLMGLIAALIKLDSPGPVLFKQQRFGFSKRPFQVYKFRSMNWASADDPLVPQAQRNDPRVTRVGRALRSSSLDELPQLINVLKGDMSLVGPRPHAIAHDEKFAILIDNYLARHRVKPGITGWAQVNGLRGETDTVDKMQRRLEFDLYYIDNWSPAFDLQILYRTLAAVLRQRNAY